MSQLIFRISPLDLLIVTSRLMPLKNIGPALSLLVIAPVQRRKDVCNELGSD
jgi:hypothetical protein